MHHKTLSILAVTLAAFFSLSISQAKAAPKPNWDIDYKLYVGVQDWKYEVWVDPPNAPAYKDSTHYSQYDASYRLFKMYEWNLIPPGSNVWIAKVSYTKWIYWLTLETYAQATDAAADWEALGFPTKIVPVFGGYFYPITISPYSSAADIAYFTDLALIMDESDGGDRDDRTPYRESSESGNDLILLDR